MARVLNVFLKDQLVGQLEQDGSGAMRFCYDETWLGAISAFPLSASLPLRRERFGRKECRPYFAGLLPEEASRQVIAKFFGVSDRNDFALLEKIGAECAGAVSLLPLDESPEARQWHYREVSREELAAKFLSLPAHPLLTGTEGIRLSLAGAQNKVVIAIREGAFHLPLGGAPSSHILKPKSSRFDGLVENEFFCMTLAARVGLPVAAVELGSVGGDPFLQIERFDRKLLQDGNWERIHQEDFCQAMGVPPELKYQTEGGPNLKKCFALVRAVSAVPGPDVLRLFDAVVFNFLIGNNDAHGKNFSFLYDGSKARLAPLYDLVCTQAYPDLSNEMAMKIGNERTPARVGKLDWRKLFKDAGLGQAAAEKRLLDLTKRIHDATIAMAAECSVNGAVPAAIIANCDRLLTLGWQQK